MQSKEHLVEWLRDAHAMEGQSTQVLESELQRLRHYPELRRQVERHLEESRHQQERLENCLRQLGGNPSSLKDLGARALAIGQSLSGALFADEVMKGAMSLYVFEHLEIASYRILIAGADALDEIATKTVCEEILKEEEAMAGWLQNYFPELTQMFLARADLRGVEAKR